ncbi:hypothetical protein DCO48_00395 [Pseudomonas sp. SDI]|uniref:DUF1127 domain-containing protein n=1 Tax=Pseudomonas sp. SDI TaxID=2170734 RepID=UPI000DE6F3F8|nr:DUF1127 domain-containing protein [Pseudomonas sp. SDI]PWB35944.1 hypothetical protein DCO48_00395 [Pseudomonas sp. SDI]
MKGHSSSTLHLKTTRHDLFGTLAQQIARWRLLYRQRQELASMSDEALHDIGLSRADILQEVERPFWDDPLKK